MLYRLGECYIYWSRWCDWCFVKACREVGVFVEILLFMNFQLSLVHPYDWHLLLTNLLRLTLTILLTSQIANSFDRPLRQVTVYTIFSLLKPPPTVLISFVRGNIHICFLLFNIRSLKTLTLIVVYLNIHNPLIVFWCFYQFICTFHALCFIFSAFNVFHCYSTL